MERTYLKVVYGPNMGQVHLLDAEQPTILGRHSRCDLKLKDRNISRWHAALTADIEGWQLSDLGSPNGTFVNGTLLDGTRMLKTDDQIRIGLSLLVFYHANDTRAAKTIQALQKVSDQTPVAPNANQLPEDEIDTSIIDAPDADIEIPAELTESTLV
jgi:pSer/pThr/pTyr-binding forkhead associated (FHA) protein